MPNNSSELCRMPVDHVCWEKCDPVGDEHYHPPAGKSPYWAHLDACARCRRAKGTFDLCAEGYKLFRKAKSDRAEAMPPCRDCGEHEWHARGCMGNPPTNVYPVLDSEREGVSTLSRG